MIDLETQKDILSSISEIGRVTDEELAKLIGSTASIFSFLDLGILESVGSFGGLNCPNGDDVGEIYAISAKGRALLNEGAL